MVHVSQTWGRSKVIMFMLWEIWISTNLLEYCDQTSITSWSEMHMYMFIMITEFGVTLTNKAVVTLLINIKCDHDMVAIPLTYPIFSSRITESITVITPVSVEIYRTIQSSLYNSPSRRGIKLTYSFYYSPVRARFEIIHRPGFPGAMVKCILTIYSKNISAFRAEVSFGYVWEIKTDQTKHTWVC